MTSGFSPDDYLKVVEALGARPTCIYASVEVKVPNPDPLSEDKIVEAVRAVHIHKEGDRVCEVAQALGQQVGTFPVTEYVGVEGLDL